MKNISQRGNKYMASVMLGGVRYKHSFNTPEDAQAWLTHSRSAHSKGLPVQSPTEIQLPSTGAHIGSVLEDVIRDQWQMAKAWKTLIGNGNQFVDYIGPHTPVINITQGHLHDYVSHLRSLGNKPATINRKVNAASVLMRKAKAYGYITRVPSIPTLREDSAGRSSDFLNREDEATLLMALRQAGQTVNALLVEFLIDTGARLGEALDLRFRDIHEGSVTFNNTKNGKFRSVPLTSRAQSALDTLRQDNGNDAYVFDGVRAGDLRSELREVYTSLGPRFKTIAQPLHIFRHTCGSRLALGGADIRRIQEWLGHADIKTTQRYMNITGSSLNDIKGILE